MLIMVTIRQEIRERMQPGTSDTEFVSARGLMVIMGTLFKIVMHLQD